MADVRILVTGGAGFIGANLVRELLASAHDVTVLDDFSTGLPSNLQGLAVDVQVGSVSDPEAVACAMTGADVVVHLAARGLVARSIADPASTHLVNATGTLNVLLAARESGAHFIFTSSSSVYGANAQLPQREEMWMQPLSPYGASKMAGESYALAFREVYEMDVLVLRLFNVYGPGQRPDHEYAAVIARFAQSALLNRPVEVHGDGNQTRDFTHVSSVVQVIVRAVEQRLSWPRPVNLAFGEHITVNDVVTVIQDQTMRQLQLVHREPRTGEIRNSRSDPALIRQLFPGIEPVALSDGIASVLTWLGTGE